MQLRDGLLCDGTDPGSAVLKDSAAVYTPGVSERRGTTSQFYHPDTQGSNRTITDSTQAVSEYSLYDAFGASISWTGSAPVPFRYIETEGYQTDLNSGFILLGNRYDDPSVASFITQDSAKDGDNWYAYCDNNPLKETDPSGLFRIVITIGRNGVGNAQIIADPGDILPPVYVGGGNIRIDLPPARGGEKIGDPFLIGNQVPNPDAPPNEEGGGGKFPPGVWPIIRYRPTYPGKTGPMGPITIEIGDPGSPPDVRQTRIHSGGACSLSPTSGCIRISDQAMKLIVAVMKLNPGRHHRIDVGGPWYNPPPTPKK